MGGVSGGVESETREGREGGSTGYGGDAAMRVGKYEEGTRVRSGLTCEDMLGGVAALTVPDDGGGRS